MERIKIKVKPRAPVRLKVSVSSSGGGASWYEGEYEVTPRIAAQTLPTAKKLMRRDVLIEGIPKWETANPYGITTIIGE